jgi:uncharacterized membrane protein
VGVLELDFAEFKIKAKEKLNGNWPTLIIITLIVFIVTGMGSENVKDLPSGVSVSYRGNIGSLISLILSGPIALGVANFYLRLVEKSEVRIERFFDGFKNFLNAFILHVVTTLFIVLWTLLFIIPGIIAAIRYSMAFLIMSENPDTTPMEAINKSKILMAGHKMEYFSFLISFIGWVLVGLITFGLGFFYLYPYFNASKIYFYKTLLGEEIPDKGEYIVESKKP